MAPTPSTYDDWIWSDQSNVHITNHPDWFVTFTCFETHVTADDKKRQVLGVGDIELTLRTDLRSRPTLGRGLETIVLRDVLYAPAALCNVIGLPLLTNYSLVGMNNKLTKLYGKSTTGVRGLVDGLSMKKFLLEGQKPGSPTLETQQICIEWSQEERQI
ncbi:hypothetical protein LTR56_004224 [Elasticomyces elasticus]|nr:hypothetical protein LTR56_004224 [Elasticomyces elasticus]KAK3655113.1 hypothetical protein LTR22_010423 [Elasticomyces elasticus]KAK4907698.1 hypothetical protein LTR49_023294 [Elasticomyces elasticus]KAK5750562.1 hypothetical protein LTS12_019352 [Elasticomyces elasticus]